MYRKKLDWLTVNVGFYDAIYDTGDSLSCQSIRIVGRMSIPLVSLADVVRTQGSTILEASVNPSSQKHQINLCQISAIDAPKFQPLALSERRGGPRCIGVTGPNQSSQNCANAPLVIGQQ